MCSSLKWADTSMLKNVNINLNVNDDKTAGTIFVITFFIQIRQLETGMYG